MKVTVRETRTKHRAWNYKKKCPLCSWDRYEMVESQYPSGERQYWVQCWYCGAETDSYSSKKAAMDAWIKGEAKGVLVDE